MSTDIDWSWSFMIGSLAALITIGAMFAFAQHYNANVVAVPSVMIETDRTSGL